MAYDQLKLTAFETLLKMKMENISYPLVCTSPGPISWFSYLINTVGSCLCVLFGVGGSIYSLFLLTSAGAKVSLVKYLIALCFWDIFLLISSFGFYGIVVLISKGVLVGPFSYICWFCYPLVNTAMTGSLWTVVLVTFERYRAVARPLTQRINEVQPVKWMCMIVLIGAFSINFPMFFEFQIMYCTDMETGNLLPILGLTMLRQNKTYIFIYRVVTYFAFNGIGPFLLVLLLTFKTMMLRRSAMQTRQRISSFSKYVMVRRLKSNSFYLRQKRTALLLTAMILKLLICHMAPMAMNFMEFLDAKVLGSEFFTELADLSNLLVILHSATNWVIYYRWHQAGERSKSKSKLMLFNKKELKRLRLLWSQIDPTDFGTEMLETQTSGKFSWAPRKVSEPCSSHVALIVGQVDQVELFCAQSDEGIPLAVRPRRPTFYGNMIKKPNDSQFLQVLKVPPLRRTSSANDASTKIDGEKVGSVMNTIITDLLNSPENSSKIHQSWRLTMNASKRKDAFTRDLTKRFVAYKLAEMSEFAEDQALAHKFSTFLFQKPHLQQEFITRQSTESI